MRGTFVLLVLALLAGQALAADQVVVFFGSVSANDTAGLSFLRIVPGSVSDFQAREGPYTAALTDGAGGTLAQMGFEPVFSQDQREYSFSGRLYYGAQAKALEIRKRNQTLYRFELPQEMACAADGKCAGAENAIACPQDCDVKTDRICTPFLDRMCDPACAPGLDLDCPVGAQNESGRSGNGTAARNGSGMGRMEGENATLGSGPMEGKNATGGAGGNGGQAPDDTGIYLLAGLAAIALAAGASYALRRPRAASTAHRMPMAHELYEWKGEVLSPEEAERRAQAPETGPAERKRKSGRGESHRKNRRAKR